MRVNWFTANRSPLRHRYDKLVQAEGVEPPESLKTTGLQPVPLPLRDKLALLKLVE